ncbi:hypothetical protein CLOM_g1363 [Closterium sp. NIES-68]|nr:hypothetical protein CLOM_g1363 [Closterium sp. NIES-68]GJP71573.1 hypothetical protein CLOP_g2398 [Closterium sp. NIES-67]
MKGAKRQPASVEFAAYQKNVKQRSRLDPVNEQHVAAAAASTSALQEKKAGGLLKVRWQCVDVEGRAGEEWLDRAAVMQRTGLHARDLRILDPLLSYPSTILGRERAIVLNLEHLKAIITAEEVLLRNPTHEGVQRFVDDLQRRLLLQAAAVSAPTTHAAPAAPGAAPAVVPTTAEAASPGAARSTPAGSAAAATASAPAAATATAGGAAAGGSGSAGGAGADGRERLQGPGSGEARDVDVHGGGREGGGAGREGRRESGSTALGRNKEGRESERQRAQPASEIETVEGEDRDRRGEAHGAGEEEVEEEEEGEGEEEDEEEEEEDAAGGVGSEHGSMAESEPLTLRLRLKEEGGPLRRGMGPEAEEEAEAGAGARGARGAKGVQHDEEEEDDDEDVEEYRPFEFIALEVALEQVCRLLASHTALLEQEAYPALDELTSRVSSLNLDRVRSMKNRMSRLIARVQKVREELEQLLDDDDDMAEMFLTRMAAAPHSPTATSLHDAHYFAFSLPAPAALHLPLSSPPPAPSPTLGSRMSIGGRWGMGMGMGGAGTAALMSRASAYSSAHSDNNEDIEELEQLLESYFVQIDSILNKLFTLREYIDDTEDYINIQIDNHRNQLIQLELVLNAGIMVTSISATVVGIFGMNIPYAWNTDPSAFAWVVALGTLVPFLLFVALVWYARYHKILA